MNTTPRDSPESRQKTEPGDSSVSPRGTAALTLNQRLRLAKLRAKLPSGWKCWISDDLTQIGINLGADTPDALATIAGRRIHAQAKSAIQALVLNRVCGIVWEQQPGWANGEVPVFNATEWRTARKEFRTMMAKFDEDTDEP